MKTRRIGLIAMAWMALFAAQALRPAPALAQTGHDLFQQALVKEQADGDLRGAIDLYERIARDFADDAALAARALIQMGQCYERLGSQEARNAYRRVLERYPNEVESVEQARARLADLQRMAAAKPKAGPPSAIRVREVWSGRYSQPVDFSGGPTPDGRGLVYVDWETGNLALRDLGTGESRQLTEGGYDLGYALWAEVSPNGKKVAYTWVDSTEMQLRVIEMRGSDPRVLYTSGEIYPLSWSRDGRFIVAATLPQDTMETRIVRIRVEDGISSTVDVHAYRNVPEASYSPDDRFLAFEHPVEEDSARFDIELLSLSDGQSLPLVRHPADDRLVGWVPGTNVVLFTSDRSGNRDLFGIRVQRGGASGDPFPIRRGVGELSPMGFTEDGSLFYYNYTLHYANSIASFDEATGRIDVAGAEPLLGAYDNCRAAWSPAGDRLVLVTREDEVGMPKGRGYTFRLRNLATGAERVLTRDLNPAAEGGPRWLSDGQSILVVAEEREEGGVRSWSEEAGLYRIDVRSGEFERLFDFPMEDSNQWAFGIGFVPTPEGDGIYYVHQGRLVLHRLADSHEVELYRDPELAAGILALSPDGSELVFGVNDSIYSRGFTDPRLHEGGRLMIMGTDGDGVRVLTRLQDSSGIIGAFFTSDAQHVLFLLGEETGPAVMRVHREGGEPERLFKADARVTVTPSPDRQLAILMAQTNEAEIWIMENLVEALREAEGH